MPHHSIVLCSPEHDGFLQKGLRDAYSDRPFALGDTVVVCGDDRQVFLESTWRLMGHTCLCGGTRTSPLLSVVRVASDGSDETIYYHRPEPAPQENRLEKGTINPPRFVTRRLALGLGIGLLVLLIGGLIVWAIVGGRAKPGPGHPHLVLCRTGADGTVETGLREVRLDRVGSLALELGFGQPARGPGLLEVRCVGPDHQSLNGDLPVAALPLAAGEPGRRINLPLSPKSGTWSPGTYRVQVAWYANGGADPPTSLCETTFDILAAPVDCRGPRSPVMRFRNAPDGPPMRSFDRATLQALLVDLTFTEPASCDGSLLLSLDDPMGRAVFHNRRLAFPGGASAVGPELLFSGAPDVPVLGTYTLSVHWRADGEAGEARLLDKQTFGLSEAAEPVSPLQNPAPPIPNFQVRNEAGGRNLGGSEPSFIRDEIKQLVLTVRLPGQFAGDGLLEMMLFGADPTGKGAGGGRITAIAVKAGNSLEPLRLPLECGSRRWPLGTYRVEALWHAAEEEKAVRLGAYTFEVKW